MISIATLHYLPGGALRIDALSRLNAIAEHETVSREYPVLTQAIRKAASAELRNLGTIGGNLSQKTRCPCFRAEEFAPCHKREPGCGCSPRPGINDRHAIFGRGDAYAATQPSDPAVALAALDAVILVRGAHRQERIAAREFPRPASGDQGQEAGLRPSELITAIELPAPAPRSGYLKIHGRETCACATVSAAVTLALDGKAIIQARIALGSVAKRPWRLEQAEQALLGLDPMSEQARAAVAAAFTEACPPEHSAHKVTLARNAVTRLIRDLGRSP
jgi:xanthine dehydrogenase YagS FAD-binding subunit